MEMILIKLEKAHINGEIESINICKSCPLKKPIWKKFNEH